MRVALVHYWILNMRGGEKVLEAFCRIFPTADIYTHVFAPEAASDLIRSHHVRTTFISRLPLARRLYQKYLPLMPLALEELDLAGYDLVISSEAGPAKGVIPTPGGTHLCYVHSPMRYLWDQYHVYKRSADLPVRAALPALAHWLRCWDAVSAARVDGFIANSSHVANRIRKYYRREASIVHPPVAVGDFAPAPRAERGDYYLWVGELVAYKRPDLAIEAFNRLKRTLIVIGDGELRAHMEKKARDNIVFLGRVAFDVLKHHMARCRALIFPGEEDFGMTPVEVMASGRPVIAYGAGGVLDTVIDGKTGLLFNDQCIDGLMEAVERFEASDLGEVNPAALVAHARQFDEAAFRRGVFEALGREGISEVSIIPTALKRQACA